MPEPRHPKSVVPKPATVEDCPDESTQVNKESKSSPSPFKRTPQTSDNARPAAPASDSGYSSIHSVPKAPASAPPAPTQKSQPAAKSKPVVTQSSEPRRSSSKAGGSRSRAQTQTQAPCRDPNCSDPHCASIRNPDRRYVLPHRDQQQPQTRSPPQPTTQYTQPAASHAVPPLAAGPRLRTQSASQARPVSFHGYPGYAYPPPNQGPPPSPSAYRTMNYYAPPQQPYAQLSYLASTPPNPMPTHPLQYGIPPVHPSPTSSAFPVAPPAERNYSARQITPNYIAPDLSKSSGGLTRTSSLSTRRPVPRQLEYEPAESDSYDSEDSCYEEEVRRRRRLSRQEMPPPRRPSIRERQTAPVIRQSIRYDDGDYVSSSDYVDSDRTQRAVVDRRTNSSYSSRSRRPSLATTRSSGRTEATTVSNNSYDFPRHVVVEDSQHGRRREYLSREAQSELIRRYKAQRMQERDLEDEIEAYQQRVGGPSNNLTADNVRQASRTAGAPGSRASRKSSTHSSTKSKTEGIKIQSGDTVLHVYGDAKVEMRAGEDGESFVIVNPAVQRSKDSSYSSRSSGSRQGRSRGVSNARPTRIREEDRY